MQLREKHSGQSRLVRLWRICLVKWGFRKSHPPRRGREKRPGQTPVCYANRRVSPCFSLNWNDSRTLSKAPPSRFFALGRIQPVLFAMLVGVSLAGAEVRAGEWRHYEIYQPEITRHYIHNPAEHDLVYNHCPAIVWYEDRWFCFWNANTIPREGALGQPIYGSTSPDGITWTPPEPIFSDPRFSENPVSADEGRQWQPTLGIIDGELWVLWCQSGGPGELQGAWLSRLVTPHGKWRHRRLTWDGEAKAVIDGIAWRVFPTQNFYRLRSGRILAPVNLTAGTAPDALELGIKDGFFAARKRTTVLYSDDEGETWQVSPGNILPPHTWAGWEPTVWEEPDGTVRMFGRYNVHPDITGIDPESSEYLLTATSSDQGATWSDLAPVPIETVCSRMYVFPADGRGVWNPPRPQGDFLDRLMLMVHNDAPGKGLNWSQGRRNIALYLNRGGGFDFVAGNGLTGFEEEVAYPQTWVHGDRLLVAYTESNASPRSIRVVSVRPLPRADRRYLLPRHNVWPEEFPAAPPQQDPATGALRFSRVPPGQVLQGKERLRLGEKAFSLGAWVRPEDGTAVLLDCRAPDGGGFVFGITRSADKVDPNSQRGVLVPFVALQTKPHEIRATLRVEPRDWQYVGLSVDNERGKAVFYVNDETETVDFKAPAPAFPVGNTPYLGVKRFSGSMLHPYRGEIRFLAVYANAFFTREEHGGLYNRFATELGDPEASDATAVNREIVLELNPTDHEQMARHWKKPANVSKSPYYEVASEENRNLLILNGLASAGLDLDANERSHGDGVGLEFTFRIENGPSQTICTVGDANEPVRLAYSEGGLYVQGPRGERTEWGPCAERTWMQARMQTAGSTTSIRVGDGPEISVTHHPRATWLYLGEGYPGHAAQTRSRTAFDIGSVRSRVIKP